MSFACSLLLSLAPQSLPPAFVPPENPGTPAKVLLGKALFWDEQLSSTNTVACGTCHLPSGGGIDPRGALARLDSTHPGPDGVLGTDDDRVGSRGVAWKLADGHYVYEPDFGLDVQVTRRRSMPMINSAYQAELFWDGRARTTFQDPESGSVVSLFDAALESQALGPILSAVEMGHVGRTWNDVRLKLSVIDPLRLAEDVPTALANFVRGRKYPELFALAFAAEANPSHIDARRIAQALATYQRTLISDDTPFDRWLAGDLGALTPEEQHGKDVFGGGAACNFCHFGAFLSDMRYHNIGVRPPVEDVGRMEVTGAPDDRGRFKTPDLRNAALRGRFFHDGSASSLEEVVDFYVRGGDFLENLSPNIAPLALSSDERADLLAFLTTGLLDERVRDEKPPFDRPRLYTESATRMPRTFAHGTPGANGEIPEAVAIEPAFLGNPRFALGLTHATSNLPTFFAHDAARGPRGGRRLFGAEVHLALGPAFNVVPVGLLHADGNGGGWHSLVCRIPDAAALAGSSLYGQWFVLDPAASGGLAASAGLEVPVF